MCNYNKRRKSGLQKFVIILDKIQSKGHMQATSYTMFYTLLYWKLLYMQNIPSRYTYFLFYCSLAVGKVEKEFYCITSSCFYTGGQAFITKGYMISNEVSVVQSIWDFPFSMHEAFKAIIMLAQQQSLRALLRITLSCVTAVCWTEKSWK